MNDYDLKSAYNHFRAGYQMWLDPGQNIPPELTKDTNAGEEIADVYDTRRCIDLTIRTIYILCIIY